ncbi:MAG TPA: aromatic ring-hydroxylating dioxygenase subunit alpha, partial [Rugosimonospora sp.]|nr:aromatic ring-hydroxylating dioxygenase subunit alpha [Rugosimonospora sp.]
AVTADGVPLVLLRDPAGAPVAWLDRCPHRLVPLSAGSPGAGVLRCAYHGWAFAPDGRCVDLPSQEPGSAVPPRAHLPAGPSVREDAGTIWVRRDDLTALPVAEPGELLSNVDEGLLAAWHPVALSSEVTDEPRVVRLVGREWTVRRDTGGVRAHPGCHGLCERWGVVWLAPQAPLVPLFDEPDAEDAAYVGAWLPPARTPAPAGIVADNFLDVAHFPFVHAGTFGAGEEWVVPPYRVTAEPDGCRSVQEQWFDNPGDPGVAAGLRPVRQRRRATYVYRAPFQLLLRLAELDAGAVKTILFFVQPEDRDSSRIYTKMLLHGIGGVDRPGPDVVAREVAFEEAVLAEDLALQRRMRLPGLPLRPRDELHVRADRLGVALRRELRRFAASATVPP